MDVFTEIIEKLDAKPVRVGFIGEMILDRYRYGYPERISREAPVIILRYLEEKNIPGGGANTLNNLLALGVQVDVATIIGDDEAGRMLLSIFEKKGIDVNSFLISPDRKTTLKERYIASGNSIVSQQLLRFDTLTSPNFPLEEKKSFLRRIREVLESNEIIVVSDYSQFIFDEEVIDIINSFATARKILVDSRKRIADFSGHFFITPNKEEALEVVDVPELELARKIGEKTASQNVVVTLGERGMVYSGEDGDYVIQRFGAGKAVDVSGAGDTVIAAIAAGVSRGMTSIEAVYFASVCAEIVVKKPFTATASIDEVRKAISEKFNG